MTAIKVNFEIGHEASLRTKKTPEGFTHDWEVFVRGPEGADISHFVEKVVFHLHETFPKPKRVVKEPPFSIKESGYAGFTFPIEIYLKNRDEPKKIKFTYDLSFDRQSGFLRDRYVFNNPNDEFKKKLLKGGGLIVNNNAYYTNPDQENKSRDSFTEEKSVSSKSKSSSEPFRKHKTKEPKEETSYFENLFGAPIHKTAKVSPDPKKIEKNIVPIVKQEKKEKDRSTSDKKSKHEHKESKSDKSKSKDDKEKIKSEKTKSSKDKDNERVKDKSLKRPSERPPSPEPPKKKVSSPPRRPPSPPRPAPVPKEEYKPKPIIESLEAKKTVKSEEKSTEYKVDKEGKEKKKKDKKSHDRDKERREKKEHKKENQKIKESPKEQIKEVPKEIPKSKELFKEKDPIKESPVKEKPPKPEKPINKFSIENLKKTPQQNTERTEEHKPKSIDSERKHKHKKKDKKRDESREKHKESSKEKKHKSDKVREPPVEKQEVERKETPVQKERPPPEPTSPISIDTASQCSSKSGIVKLTSHDTEEINSDPSDSEESVKAEEENIKVKKLPSPEPPPKEPTPEPIPEPVVEPHKEKSKKHKDKSSKREEKKRKRKEAEEENDRKVPKVEEIASLTTDELGESSGIVSMETKLQDNGVSSSLGEEADPGDLSPDYMVQLRGLQKRIMTIKSNEELERVVSLIAETGRYEVTTQTFDFDLCLLDRSTVQQLIQLVGC